VKLVNYKECSDGSDHDDAGSDEGTDGSVQDVTAGECANGSEGKSSSDGKAPASEGENSAGDAAADSHNPKVCIGRLLVSYAEFDEGGTAVRGISVGVVTAIDGNVITVRDISTASENSSRAVEGCLNKDWYDPGARSIQKLTETVLRADIIASFEKLKKMTGGHKLPKEVRNMVRKYMKEQGRAWGPIPERESSDDEAPLVS
jgi:hypothetical protein